MAKLPDRIGLRVGAAALVFASLAACSTGRPVPGAGGLGAGLGAGSAPAVSPPSVLPSASPAASGSTPASTSRTATGSTSKSTPHPATSVKVTVHVGSQGSVTTTVCPHHFMFGATISVDAGPVDVVYSWLRDGTTKTTPTTLHFAGTGAQTMTVTDDDPETLAAGTVTDTVRVVGPFVETVPIRHPYLQCTASAAKPVVSSKPAACPLVTFASLLSVPISGQRATYTWHFSGGQPDIQGQFTFAPGVTKRFVAINKRISGSLTAWLQVTNGAGMTTDKTAATCP